LKRILPASIVDFLKNNFFYSGLSYGLKMFNNIVIFALLARFFPIAVFGIISLFIVLIKLAETFTDYGHKLVVIKELSVDQKLLDDSYLSNKFGLKSFTFFVVLLGMILYAYTNQFWDYSPLLIVAIVLAGYFSSLTNLNFAIFHSHNKYIYETVSLVLLSFSLGLALIASRFMVSESVFIYGYFLGVVVMFLFSSYLVKWKIKAISFKNIFSKISLNGIGKEFKIILPFASIVIIEALFGNFDTLMVENYCSGVDLGLYTGVKKIVAGLTILMLICSSAIMPMLSRMSKSNIPSSKYKIFFLFCIVSFLGLCLFMGYFFYNKEVVLLLLGEKFLDITEWDTQVGLLTLTSYVRIVPGIYFITSDNEKKRLFITCTGLIFGVLYFYLYLPGQSVKFAVKSITEIKVAITAIYCLIFFYILLKPESKKLKTISE